jgi:hypothetical protein
LNFKIIEKKKKKKKKRSRYQKRSGDWGQWDSGPPARAEVENKALFTVYQIVVLPYLASITVGLGPA